jgi:predicted component of type VI protein secretion system
MRVKNGRIEGYVKPLFADMDVYDVEQDKDKNVFQQLKEALVGAGTTVLENRPRSEVATVASLSGPVENPNASTLDVILGLLRNAFIKAILPGLEPHRR